MSVKIYTAIKHAQKIQKVAWDGHTHFLRLSSTSHRAYTKPELGIYVYRTTIYGFNAFLNSTTIGNCVLWKVSFRWIRRRYELNVTWGTARARTECFPFIYIRRTIDLEQSCRNRRVLLKASPKSINFYAPGNHLPIPRALGPHASLIAVFTNHATINYL